MAERINVSIFNVGKPKSDKKPEGINLKMARTRGVLVNNFCLVAVHKLEKNPIYFMNRHKKHIVINFLSFVSSFIQLFHLTITFELPYNAIDGENWQSIMRRIDPCTYTITKKRNFQPYRSS